MKLPKFDSTTARTLRVIAYEIAGLLIAVLAQPDAVQFLKDYYPQVLVILTGFAPLATAIVNLLRPSVKNY
jgi:hypothetical protein